MNDRGYGEEKQLLRAGSGDDREGVGALFWVCCSIIVASLFVVSALIAIMRH